MTLAGRLDRLRRAWTHRRELRRALAAHLDLVSRSPDHALGTLAAAEEERIVELVHRAARHAGPLVEIGTLFGLTTRLMAQHAPAGRQVITVDDFSWNPLALPRELHELLAGRILRSEIAAGQVVLETSASAAFRGRYRGPAPALVFLDADHAYEPVRDEIAWARGLGVPIICGHDYGRADFGVTRAVDEAFPGGVEVRGTVWSWERDA